MYLTLSGNGSRAARTEVLQSKSVAADRRAFPSSGAGRLSDAHGRRRQLQRRQSHRCGGRLGRENVFGEQVLQGRLRQELQSHHRRGLRHGTLPRARRALQPAAVGHGGSGALQVHRLHVLPRGSSHHCGLRPEQRELLSPRQAVVGGRHEGERPLQRSSLPRGHQERSQLSRAAGSGGRGSRQDVGRTRSRVLGRVGKVGCGACQKRLRSREGVRINKQTRFDVRRRRRREGFLSPRGLFDLRGQCPLRAGKTKREHDRRHQDLERPAGRAQAGQEEVRLLLM
ncbi:uncharacterized protein LOC133491490 isoform X7 [Syngnathoides biaculeatus]|uniref:uncharacterized protein LOC133491490 isoform X7 n=1 Tax=Syngnathoides biaculeatus TaxID=300417 RepID=UPI002ADE5779|nr:uncharacterized protein LOC133491490 isoform X7 [Syngnathoides biaculeatus]